MLYAADRPVPPLFLILRSRLSLVLTSEGHCSSTSSGGATTSTSVCTELTLLPTRRVAVTLYRPGSAYLWRAAWLVVLKTPDRSPKSHRKVLTAAGTLRWKATAR